MGAAAGGDVLLVRASSACASCGKAADGRCRFKLVIPGAEDSSQVVRTQAVARGVLALPGTVFLPDGRASAYVRAAFSLLSEQEVDEAMRRLRATILDARSAASGEK